MIPMQTSMITYFEEIRHGPGGNSERILRRIDDVFARHPEEFLRAGRLAREAAEIVRRLDPVMERHTSSVCPRCATVCCANRHSYHTHEDIVYLRALGEKVPAYDHGVGDDDPCRFIGDRGCSISRVLRPHRCNSYFCTPLLAHMEDGEAREYRGFVESMRKLTDTRIAVLLVFAEAATKPVAGRPIIK